MADSRIIPTDLSVGEPGILAPGAPTNAIVGTDIQQTGLTGATGTIAQTLFKVTEAATGIENVTGTITQTLKMVTMSATGKDSGLFLDGTPVTASSTSPGATASMPSFSTTLTNDILILEVFFFTSLGTTSTVASIADNGSGGTWVRRSRQVIASGSLYSGDGLVKETWWRSAAAIQTGITVTSTLSNAGTTTYLSGVLYAVHGCQNLVNPWDSNSSLPAVVANAGTGSTTTHTISGISTSSQNTFLVAAMNMNPPSGSTPPAASTDTGFNAIGSPANVAYQKSMVESRAFSAKQSGLSYSVNNGNAVYDYIITIDALTDGSANGTIAQTLKLVTQAVAGGGVYAGTIQQTLKLVTQVAGGALPVTGTIHQTLKLGTQVATGSAGPLRTTDHVPPRRIFFTC